MAADTAELTTLETTCERYLAAQNYSLFGDYDISDPDRRRVAARWLARHVAGVLDQDDKDRGLDGDVPNA